MISREQIEFVARRMCVHLGVNPDARMQELDRSSRTSLEKAMNPPPYYYPPGILAWMTLGREAEAILVGYRALRDLRDAGIP